MSYIFNWFKRKIPRNYLLKYPSAGALIVFLFIVAFGILYQPVGSHESRLFNYPVTTAVYALVAAAFILAAIRILKTVKPLVDEQNWTIWKELLSVLIALTGMGIGVYLIAFIIEEPADRLNLSTLFDSIIRSFLIGIIPFAFFTAVNHRYLFASDEALKEENTIHEPGKPAEVLVKISSQLKKEELSFYPREFLYAMSEGNYVNFYLFRDNHFKKEVIRNSISNIEKQLSSYPYLYRTHRAFIVNINKIRVKKGNVLGYRLKLAGIDQEIPVSRNNTGDFNKVLKQYSS